MALCAKCSVENADDAKFCRMCGAPLGTSAVAASPPPPPPPSPPFAGPGRLAANALVDLWSFAIFLVVLGTVFALHPGVFGDAFSWFRDSASAGAPVRPSDSLIRSAALLFGLGGALGFVTAALRFAVTRNRQRVLAEVLSAIGGLAFAFLLTLYGDRVLSGGAVLGILVAVVGLLVLVYVVTSIAMNWTLWKVGWTPGGPSLRK